MTLLVASILVAPVAPSSIGAQTPAPRAEARGTGIDPHASAPVAHAAPASSTPRIDGRLDDAAWEGASPITTFTQRDPEEGAPVSQPTSVRILYDAEAIYIGARLDDAVGVTSRLGRRDMALLNADWFSVTIDSYHDHRTAFRFQVNPAGVQRDATITMGGGGEGEDLSWDAVWEVATSIDDGGWSVEMRIPFSQLRFRTGGEQTWGIQLERVIGRRGEVAWFSFVPKAELAGVSRYAHLQGIQDIGRARRLEVLPYAAARGEYVDRAANPFRGDREQGLSVGADLLYGVTSNLTLNATVNPDFGQVEVDPAIVNLGVYETFFPEQRPFFIEGREIFGFTGNTSGGNLFYSRRIGRRPQLGPPSNRVDFPDATTILGAGKLSGRSGGWSIGVLEAVTAREEARWLDAQDAEHRWEAEPLTNYFFSRVRRDLRGGRSAIGGALGSVIRDLDTPEARLALRSSAWSGGTDFRHEWAQRSWLLTGSAALTHVVGSEESIILTQRQSHHYFQRPDATHLGVDTTTALTGYQAGVNLTKQAGTNWTGSLAAALTSPRFEANDLGFATRTDRRDLQGLITYAQNQPGRRLRNWNTTAVIRHETNFDGDAVQTTLQLNQFARHLDFWSVQAGLTHRLPTFDDRSTRGGPMMRRPRESGGFLAFGSDPRRPITYSANIGGQRNEYGGENVDVGGSVAFRTSPSWLLSVGPTFSTGRIAAQYLTQLADPAAEETFGRRYLFAPLDFTQLNATIRLNVTFTPRLSLETFMQPLIFSSDYGEVGSLVAPRTFDFQPFAGPLPQLDNTLRSLRGNAVLRWEWRPGSTLYVAWQQTRSDVGPEGTFDMGRDPRRLLGPPDNIIVVKGTYWLSL